MTIANKPSLIYKICTATEWHDALRTGAYIGSADDQRDGFIHLSSVQQLRGTADKHFSGQPDLVLISINAAQLDDRLKWEPSRGGQLFPHCYGDLPTSSAVVVRPLPLDANGHHVFPDDVSACDVGADDVSQVPKPACTNRGTN